MVPRVQKKTLIKKPYAHKVVRQKAREVGALIFNFCGRFYNVNMEKTFFSPPPKAPWVEGGVLHNSSTHMSTLLLNLHQF
jgi:hypothetical protein